MRFITVAAERAGVVHSEYANANGACSSGSRRFMITLKVLLINYSAAAAAAAAHVLLTSFTNSQINFRKIAENGGEHSVQILQLLRMLLCRILSTYDV